MIAHCDHCEKSFDTHEGGSICSRCGRVFCPKCEDCFFEEDADFCKECSSQTPLMKALWAVVAACERGDMSEIGKKLDVAEAEAKKLGVYPCGSPS